MKADENGEDDVNMFNSDINASAAQCAFDGGFHIALSPWDFSEHPQPRHGEDKDEENLLQP
jgi:hypothetical protein